MSICSSKKADLFATDVKKLQAQFNLPSVSYAVFDQNDIYAGLTSQDEEVSSSTLFSACSMSKTITALLVLQLAETKYLDLDKPINQCLKHWHLMSYDDQWDEHVTLAHLLNHTSGIQDEEGAFGPLKKGDLVPTTLSILTGQTPYNPKPIKQQQPLGEFCYSDAAYCLIEYLIEEVTGQRFAELAQQHIFKPLGMRASMFAYPLSMKEDNVYSPLDHKLGPKLAMGHDKTNCIIPPSSACYPYLAAAGLWSHAHDLAVLMQSLVKGVVGQGHLKNISHLLTRMLSSEASVNWTGFGIFLNQTGLDTLAFSQGWGVGFQCKMLSRVKQNQGLVVLTNQDPGCDQDQAFIGHLIRAYQTLYYD